LGSPTNEVDRGDSEGPQTAVTISRGFWMGKYLVTQGDYLSVVGTNPSWFTPAEGYSEDLTRPVEKVSWFDATNYCGLLTQRELAAGRIPANSVYRLPTEAEWEYACRAWTSTRFSYGDDPGYTDLMNYAWYGANVAGMTEPVGQKLPNLWGLYDMHGNVDEWCQNWSYTYSGGIALDPQGPATDGTRATRGGHWDAYAWECRSASRGYNNQNYGFYSIGFRVLLTPHQS